MAWSVPQNMKFEHALLEVCTEGKPARQCSKTWSVPPMVNSLVGRLLWFCSGCVHMEMQPARVPASNMLSQVFWCTGKGNHMIMRQVTWRLIMPTFKILQKWQNRSEKGQLWSVREWHGGQPLHPLRLLKPFSSVRLSFCLNSPRGASQNMYTQNGPKLKRTFSISPVIYICIINSTGVLPHIYSVSSLLPGAGEGWLNPRKASNTILILETTVNTSPVLSATGSTQ